MSKFDEIIEKQFNTNVFGLMRVTREAIKYMRPNGGGIIIQISSMGGKITFPLYSIYHSTKFAVEGFTESLHYELDQFKIKMKLNILYKKYCFKTQSTCSTKIFCQNFFVKN